MFRLLSLIFFHLHFTQTFPHITLRLLDFSRYHAGDTNINFPASRVSFCQADVSYIIEFITPFEMQISSLAACFFLTFLYLIPLIANILHRFSGSTDKLHRVCDRITSENVLIRNQNKMYIIVVTKNRCKIIFLLY